MSPLFRLAFLFLLLPQYAKSQADAKAVFLSINKQAAAIDEALAKMNAAVKADRHKEIEPQTHAIEAALGNIEKQSGELPPEDSEKLRAIANGFKTDLSNFEKLAHKSALFDNDKAMAAAFAPMKSRQSSLRDFLRAAYSAVVAAPEKEKKPDTASSSNPSASTTAQTPPTQPQPQQPAPQKAEPPVQDSGASDAEVLADIRETENRMTAWIDTLHTAVKKNQFAKIRTLAKNIAGAAAKIADLAVLLKDEQKASIQTLATGLRQYAERLQALSAKGHAVHQQMHEALERIETRFSVLSTGIRILK